MKTVFLVTREEADLARKMEQKLLALPESAGILFVSIEVIQDPFQQSREILFNVFVGCTRERDASLMDVLVRRYLREDIHEAQLVITSRRGFVRS